MRQPLCYPKREPGIDGDDLLLHIFEKCGAPTGDACWPWPKPTPDGYGLIGYKGGTELVHRVSYALAEGIPVEDVPLLRHRCDFRACCNPDHLMPGTQAENMADMKARGRSPDRTGERNPIAKLTWPLARAIRVAVGKQRDIARQYGVSQAVVWAIRNNRTWRE